VGSPEDCEAERAEVPRVPGEGEVMPETVERKQEDQYYGPDDPIFDLHTEAIAEAAREANEYYERKYLAELRDRIALAALNGLLSSGHCGHADQSPVEVARLLAGECYIVADAMLEVRGK